MKQEYDFSKAVRGKFFREGAEIQLPICSDRGPNTHQRPNLFNYATKELSQDAVICWLVACATEATGDLQKCGLEFVRTLFRAGKSDRTGGVPVLRYDGERDLHDGPCDVSDVSCPSPQYDRIDVYFQAKVDGKTVSFIIEDKKDGSTDSKQLAGHLEVVIGDEEKEDLIKPIYFKTGYVFSDEREAVEKDKYSVFEAEDMTSFLGSQDATRENEILRQYTEYLAAFMEPRIKAQQEWDLDQDHVQWEFMLKLRDRLRDVVGEWQSFMSGFPDWTWGGLGRDTNKGGGGSWTQYWFARHLFWRFDSWHPLRLMIDREQAGSVEGSDVMLYEYRNCFTKALQEGELSDGGIDVDNSRGNQCTVGSVEITNFQGMTESEFLDRIKQVHIRFLESISIAIYPLLTELWREVESALQEEIPDLPPKSEKLSDVSEKKIKRFEDHGLYYPFSSGAASLCVRLEEGSIFFGVRCEDKDEHRGLDMELREALGGVSGGNSEDWWPWWTWADGDLEPLKDREARRNYAKGIAQGLKPVWDAIKRAGLN